MGAGGGGVGRLLWGGWLGMGTYRFDERGVGKAVRSFKDMFIRFI